MSKYSFFYAFAVYSLVCLILDYFEAKRRLKKDSEDIIGKHYKEVAKTDFWLLVLFCLFGFIVSVGEMLCLVYGV